MSVSILIPCFNAERWIASAIESAIGQTAPSDVIVLDDGSTDRSVELIGKFKDQIRFEAGPNRGGNVARNRLLEMAQGEWVQFLDADDYLHPEKIERQLQTPNKPDSIDVIYSPVTCETWDGNSISDTSVIDVDVNQSLEEQWIRWQVAQTGGVLWKRESLMEIGGWNADFPCCQDNEITFRAIKSGLKFHFCGRADAVYRIWSDDTVCRRNPPKVIQYKTKLIDEMLKWLQSEGRLTESHSVAAGQAFFEMARTLTKFDPVAAESYASERIKAGTFSVTGPAAPRNYQLVYRVLGFRNAERIAGWVRR